MSSSWNDDASQTIDRVRRRACPGSDVERRADVARDHDRQPRRAVDVADQLDRRRLAVGAGERDELVLEQPPAELELADHARCPRASAAATTGASRGTPGALDHGRDAGEQVRALLPVAHLDARRPAALPAPRRRPRARPMPDHALAARRQRLRGGHARAGEAERRGTGRAEAAGARSRPPFKRAALTGLASRPRSVPVSNGHDGSSPDQDADPARRPCVAERRRCRPAATAAWSRTCATSGRPATGARRSGVRPAAHPRRGR